MKAIKPQDYAGNEIKAGDTIVVIRTRYRQEKKAIFAINPKTNKFEKIHEEVFDAEYVWEKIEEREIVEKDNTLFYIARYEDSGVTIKEPLWIDFLEHNVENRQDFVLAIKGVSDDITYFKKHLLSEFKKCQESPAYFYNKYFKSDNAREITDEEIENMKKQVNKLKKRKTLLS